MIDETVVQHVSNLSETPGDKWREATNRDHWKQERGLSYGAWLSRREPAIVLGGDR
jgi:hypothetical protein